VSNTNEPKVRYVALRALDVGDERIQPGEEVPVDSTWQTVRELVDGGYMVAIPVPPGEGPLLHDFAQDWRQPGSNGPTAPEEATEDDSEDSGDEEDDDNESEDEEEGTDDNEAVTSSGYDPSEFTVEEVVTYAEENLDELDEIIAAETAGRGRKTLLAQLQTQDGE